MLEGDKLKLNSYIKTLARELKRLKRKGVPKEKEGKRRKSNRRKKKEEAKGIRDNGYIYIIIYLSLTDI